MDATKPTHCSEKLSKLQKQILVFALANKIAEGRGFGGTQGADVYYAEIFMKCFGFPMKEGLHACYSVDCGRRRVGSPKFDPGKIGVARYNAVQASVSRAMLRLHERGLVVCMRGRRWAGCNLTERGVEIAQTVNGAVKVPHP